LARLFSFKIVDIPNGSKITLREERDKWGDNKQIFEDSGIQPTCLELTFVALSFRRPLAQRARFFSLSAEPEGPLSPLLTELTWWSIIERSAIVSCAFIQDGHTYENPMHNITEAALLPNDEQLAIFLTEEAIPSIGPQNVTDESETISLDQPSEAPVINLAVAFTPKGPYREVTTSTPWVIVFTLNSVKPVPTQQLALDTASAMARAYGAFLSQLDDHLKGGEGYWLRERHMPAEAQYTRFSTITAWGIVRIPSQFDPRILSGFSDIKQWGRVDDVYVQPWAESTHEVVIHFHRVGANGDSKDSQRVITRGLRFDEIFDLNAARDEQVERPASFFRDLLAFLHSRLKSKFGGMYTLEDNVFYITSGGMGDSFDLPETWWPLINSGHVRGTSDAILAKAVDRVYIHNSEEEDVKEIFGK
jgi:hypothetical protein